MHLTSHFILPSSIVLSFNCVINALIARLHRHFSIIHVRWPLASRPSFLLLWLFLLQLLASLRLCPCLHLLCLRCCDLLTIRLALHRQHLVHRNQAAIQLICSNQSIVLRMELFNVFAQLSVCLEPLVAGHAFIDRSSVVHFFRELIVMLLVIPSSLNLIFHLHLRLLLIPLQILGTL